MPELDEIELRLRTKENALNNEKEKDNFTFSNFLPPSHKEKPLIDFKHNLFYEEKEEVQESLIKLRPLEGSRVSFIIKQFFLNL